jgi:serine/threonine protein kinase
MADRPPSERTRRPNSPRDKAPGASAPAPAPKPSDDLTGHSNQPTLAGGSSPTLPQTKALGQLPDFELLKELGRGGNGIVYKARQISLDRIVAVKMLPAERAKNAATLARFLEEARAAASFTHPNIVAVHHIGECPAGHYFVMEYVQGVTLQALLDGRGPDKPVPVAWTVQVLVTLATAVHHAHQRGIFHRDLKPSNIIIEKGTGRPVVLDFGIARRLDRTGVPDTAVGTPAYMSPEQAGEAVGTLGTPSDVYALGAILYRMLTGRLPFAGATPLDTLLLVAGPNPAEPVRKYRPDVPPGLNAICMKCLSKKPLERYQSCEALAKDLKSFQSAPVAKSPPAGEKKPAAPAGPGVILESEQSGKKVRLTKAISVIGRSAECDVLIKREDVSKRHCRILIDGAGAEVEDLDSTSGTTVNGEPVTRRALASGDRLRVAKYSFRVTLDLKPKS